MQLLTEISLECKDKAVLLYKVFKLYFVEQEKKWIFKSNLMKDKINFYKDFTKFHMQENNKELINIKQISEMMLSNKTTEENLKNHKEIINQLLNEIYSKKNQIYLLNSKTEILDKELNFWMYGIDKIKIDEKIRKKFNEFDSEKVIQNLNEESKTNPYNFSIFNL